MSWKTLMIIKAVVCLVFGPLLLFFPEFLMNLLGFDSFGDSANFTARIYGAALFGNLMLTWFGMNAEKSKATRAINLDLFLYDAIGLVVTLVMIFSYELSFLIWGIAFVYLFFTVGFGYYLLKEQA